MKLKIKAELAAEAETFKSDEELFRATFEQAAVGITHIAPDGHWLRVDRQVCETVGYWFDELFWPKFQVV